MLHRPALLIGLAAACSSPTPATPVAPVYYGDVQRILNDSCVECHSADPDRLAPFSLATYQDAVAAAENTPINYAVMNRTMPPYYATNDGSCQTFTSKWLSDDDLARLTAWTQGTRPAGDPARSVAPPPPEPGLARADHVLDTGTSYQPDQAVADDYRCFVVDGIGADRFVTGYEVRPGNLSVVHHVIVFSLGDAQSEADVVARDAAAPGPGYPCFSGPTDAGASFLVGWAPGGGAREFPAQTGIPLVGARKLVVQLHYNVANSDGMPDRTTVALSLADQVTHRAQIISVRGDVNLPPRTVDAVASGTRGLPRSLGDLRIWGAALHMHQRGTAAEVSVDRGGNTCLADLASWSFHWQHMYWYQQPVAVAGGDTLRVTCHYDTSSDVTPVKWGESSTDEMCLAYLYVSQ
jgi:hypothetical protein